jgi:hypothetical protein
MGPKFLCRLTLLQTHFRTVNCSLNWLKTFTPAYFTGDFFQGHIDEGWRQLHWKHSWVNSPVQSAVMVVQCNK